MAADTTVPAQAAGLPSREAARRLEQFGANAIRRQAGPGRARALGAQLVHPLALLLWVAAVLALVGGLGALAAAIVVVIFVNAVFAFAQEMQAERATEALEAYLPARARVLRDGAVHEVAATELVPGDVMLLSEGDRISADATLLEGALEVDMAALTGESQPVTRAAGATPPGLAVLEREDLVFAGTLCTQGEAVAQVTATAMATQLGRIAALSEGVRGSPSPLQRQVTRAARLIAVVAVTAGAAFFVIGVSVAGLPLTDALNFAIGLLVANVPEGLLPTITLALAVGVRRMAKRRALMKRLTAVETLGSTDVICTDKTGTLTEGRMAPVGVWTARGSVDVVAGERADGLDALLRCAVLCNNATLTRSAGGWSATGDPSEAALLQAAARLGADVEAMQAARRGQRRRLLSFDPRRKRMSTIDAEDGSLRLHAKGAPLELLERCSSYDDGRGEAPLDDAARDRVATEFRARAAAGLRVLGLATRRVEQDALELARDEVETGLCFLGLVSLHDPPREAVHDAVARCRRAGIRIIVITGDDGLTAAAIARQVGIVGAAPLVLSGPEVDALDDGALEAVLRDSPELIVARSSPEAKLRIVDALREEGHTVAMTGDGVNDAPALRRADIGVAMGASGTDVAREAATMVLTDDSFASIVAAVEEGRVVFDNLRKFVTYIFAHATPEVVPFLLYALAGGAIPLPITALQILAIDLGTETLPALALGREPAEPGIMERRPRPRGQGILDGPMLLRAWVWLGLLEAILVTGAFFVVLLRGGWSLGAATGSGTALHHVWLQATAMTFAAITACQVGTAFAARTTRASLRDIGVLSNRLLLWGIAFELVFAAAVVYAPPLQAVFATAAPPPADLAILAGFPIVVWGSDELRRAGIRRRSGPGAQDVAGAATPPCRPPGRDP